MPNNYVQFSTGLIIETPEEEAWLRHQLDCDRFLEEMQALDECVSTREWAENSGLVLWSQFWENEYAGFSHKFETDRFQWPDPDTGELVTKKRRQLWIYGEEYGNPGPVADLVQEFLARFHPDKSWSLQWAEYCSRLCLDEFGGGAVLVTAKKQMWMSTDFWLVEREKGGPIGWWWWCEKRRWVRRWEKAVDFIKSLSLLRKLEVVDA